MASDEGTSGGAPAAPSATPPPRPPWRRIAGLLGEFLRMSRTTVLLLTAFVLVGAVYLLVRDDPVVDFGRAPVPTPASGAPTTPDPARTEPPTTTTAAGERSAPATGASTSPAQDDPSADAPVSGTEPTTDSQVPTSTTGRGQEPQSQVVTPTAPGTGTG